MSADTRALLLGVTIPLVWIAFLVILGMAGRTTDARVAGFITGAAALGVAAGAVFERVTSRRR